LIVNETVKNFCIEFSNLCSRIEKKLSESSSVQEEQTKKRGYFMCNIKERKKFDNYEMLDEYDFSDGVRGRFYEPKKIPVSLRLYNDIVLYFKKLASEQKVPYQTLINALLR